MRKMQTPPDQQHPPAKLPPGIEWVAPPAAGASPCQVRGLVERDVEFWMPGWGDVLSHLGWRWLLVGPPLVLALVLVILPFWLGFLPPLWWLVPKAVVMLVAVPLSVMTWLVRTAVRRRKEAFCIYCGYGLVGLPDNYRCPECGRPYTFALIDEYRRDPHWYVRRWKSQHETPPADVPFTAGTNLGPRSRDGT
jgi:hypothetical protein